MTPFVSHRPEFAAVLGDNARLVHIVDTDAHEGPVYVAEEHALYVTDSGANQEPGSFHPNRPHHVVAYDVVAGRQLRHRRLFAVTTPGFPDGIAVDSAGRVYVSSFSGVQVFNDVGDLIGEIRLPGAVNFTFGGPDRGVLFITTDTAVWAAVLQATGLPRTGARTSERSTA